MKNTARGILLVMTVVLTTEVVAQKTVKPLKLKYTPSSDVKWSMFGLNRVHLQDFSITDQYTDTCNCAESERGLLSKANVSVNLGFYSNLSKRFAVSGDVGLAYGSYLRKDPTVVAEKYRGRFRTQTLRFDAYYHLTDNRLQMQPYVFSGFHFSQRNPNWLTIPIGLGTRYRVFNNNAMITAQVGYGFGMSGSIKNSIIYSWGIYLNTAKKNRSVSVPTATMMDGVSSSCCSTTVVDTDYDGVTDANDKCPNVAGAVSNEGCPVTDRDRDGIVDSSDKCPDVSGPISNLGCPILDRDADGLSDLIDRCPDIFGLPENYGCPASTTDKSGSGMGNTNGLVMLPARGYQQGLKTIIGDTVQYIIYFDFDKYDLTSNSFDVLNDAIDYLKKNDEYKVSLVGHTDLEGDNDYNTKLSQNRVKTTRSYLMSYGIKDALITTSFYGKTKPAIPSFDKGLAWKNRRVEIFLIKN